MQRYSTELGYEHYIQINNQTVLTNKTVQIRFKLMIVKVCVCKITQEMIKL